MIIKKNGLDALSGYEERFEASRWNYARDPNLANLARNRLNEDVFRPIIETDFDLQGKSFFTMGSCFAREVELALSRFGRTVLSKVEADSPIAFRRGGYTNRYNTASMLNELEFALGLKEYNQASIIEANRENHTFMDLHSHPAGGFCSFDDTLVRRQAIQSLFSKIREADVFICTLGLTEVWFDHETGEYINVSPTTLGLKDYYPDRFEFRVLDFNDNMENLEKIHHIARKHLKSDLKIVVTVSPVPLLATFSGRDVVRANAFSKSTLRSCAESWVYAHPGEIDYFPSYEMAMNSNRDVVWQEDLVHVSKPFVREIMRTFLSAFNCVEDKAELAQTKAEKEELEQVKVESLQARGDNREAIAALDKMMIGSVKKRKLEHLQLKLLVAENQTDAALALYRKIAPEVKRPDAVTALAESVITLAKKNKDVALMEEVMQWVLQSGSKRWGVVRLGAAFLARYSKKFPEFLPSIEEKFGDLDAAKPFLEKHRAA